MSTLRGNLPARLIRLVGRENEIGDLISLLQNPEIRLITIYGFGGAGKTRLAVETAQAALDLFPDGVWFVALAPLNSAENLLTATASALGFAFGSSVDQKNQLFSFLQGKQTLLIFDNLEHLLPEAGGFLKEILQSVPQARMLVTSRQPLNAPWEWAYPLRGLAFQSEQAVAQGQRLPAVELFLQLLRQSGQPVSDEDALCAAQISELVNGLPLAMILAASWGRALGCNEIAQEIKRGIGFLRARQPLLPDKHSSMDAVFDYSWRLLSESEQAALRKMAVFRGGFHRAAVEALTGANLSVIATLVDQSLIERTANDRYQAHEMLRQYLQVRLIEAGEEQAARTAHLAYYTSLAEQAEPELFGEQQNEWIDRLTLETGNFSAALEWCQESQEPAHIELGLRLLVATERLWILPLFTKTGFTYLGRLLKLASEEQFPYIHGRAVNLAGWLASLLEELPESRQFTAQALQIGLGLNDRRLVGDAYYIQSIEAFYRKDYPPAQAYAHQSLAYYQEIHDYRGTLQALENLARCEIYNSDFSSAKSTLAAALDLAKERGDTRIRYSILRGLGELGMLGQVIEVEQARAYFEEGLGYARQFNDQFYISHTLNSLGELARIEGQFEQAASYYKEAIAIEKKLGRKDEVVLDEGNLGFALLRQGEFDESKVLFLKNLDLSLNSTYPLPVEVATCLLGLAGIVVSEGEAQLAAKLLGAIHPYIEPLL
ncbi:MAG: hypothetical protein EHM70_09145, partial [Chloroflexota bacterium]